MEMKLVLALKVHPYWLSFIVLEGAILTTRGENSHQSPPIVTHASYSHD